MRPFILSLGRGLGLARNGGKVKVKTLSFSAVRAGSTYKPCKTWVDPHMDEFPIPDGCWDADNKKRQAKNNKHLFLGTSFFLFTVFALCTSGLVTLNYNIPKLDPNMMSIKPPKCKPEPPTCD